jgi:hypothetical protein
MLDHRQSLKGARLEATLFPMRTGGITFLLGVEPTSFSPLKTKRHCKSTHKFSNIGPPPSRSEFTMPYYVYISFPSMVKAPSSRVQSTKLQHCEVCHRKQELETSIQSSAMGLQGIGCTKIEEAIIASYMFCIFSSVERIHAT